MHHFKQFAVSDAEAATTAIPIIDCGPFFAGEPGACSASRPTSRTPCEGIAASTRR